MRLGGVSVNGIVTLTADYKTHIGDVINFSTESIPEERPSLSPDSSVQFEILHEDADILVINKPAGVVVHAGAGNHEHTLVNGLMFHCNLSNGSDDFRPGIVHRIDKDTSGILVVAKNDFAHAFLSEQFAVHSIVRKYVCFCYGVPRLAKNIIDTKIIRDKNNRLRMSISENSGKRAITIYRTLHTFRNFATEIECELKTGRTHQIRVHMSSLGHSLIGDKLYKYKNYSLPKEIATEINQFPRQALHAKYLEFIHPSTKENMVFESDLPQDLQQLKNLLQQYNS